MQLQQQQQYYCIPTWLARALQQTEKHFRGSAPLHKRSVASLCLPQETTTPHPPTRAASQFPQTLFFFSLEHTELHRSLFLMHMRCTANLVSMRLLIKDVRHFKNRRKLSALVSLVQVKSKSNQMYLEL